MDLELSDRMNNLRSTNGENRTMVGKAVMPEVKVETAAVTTAQLKIKTQVLLAIKRVKQARCVP